MYHKSLFPPLPQLPPQNIHNILVNRPAQTEWQDYPLHVNALTGATRSFRQFLETVRDGATALASDVNLGGLGIRPGNNELVGVLSENSMDYVALLHSLLVMTVPFATFSSYSTPFEFQHIIKLAAPTRLFVSPTMLPLALDSGFSNDRIYILEGHVPGRVCYRELVERARRDRLPRLPVQPAQKDTLAYLIFSSGTSGLPKGVMISHGNLLESFAQLTIWAEEALKAQGPPETTAINVAFNVLPMYHSYGLHLTTFTCFLSPVTLVLLPKWNTDTFFDSISKYRVTNVYLVPSLVHQIVHHPRFLATDFSTVQAIASGAAHLPVSLAEKLRARLPCVERVGEGYGMSECTFSIAMKPVPGMLGGKSKNVSGSVGVLMPGMEARVVRENGQLASLNEVGELHVRGGTVSFGYWRNQKATSETFKDGWLHTGDRIRIDADGVLYFEDRAKDTLKVSGVQVSPMEIEETLLKHSEHLIVDVAVAGVSGGRTQDERVPRAWVVLSPAGNALDATEVVARLDAWVREALSRQKWLRGGVGIVKQIPKSPTGKVLRRALVDEYEAKQRTRAGQL